MKITNDDYRLLSCVFIYFGAYVSCLKDKYTTPDEISSLFSDKSNNNSTIAETTVPIGSVRNENKIFSEGSSSTIKMGAHDSVESSKVFTQLKGNDSHPAQESVKPVTEEGDNVKISSNKTIEQKLKQETLDFMTGADEISHSSGTSSIKPRKGVSYSKVVPKKGVNFDHYMNYDLPSNHFCFILNQSDCYNIDNYTNLECICCNSSNDLGKLIGRQPKINCETCMSIKKVPDDISKPCPGLCCHNNNNNNNNTDIVTAKPDNKVLVSNKNNSNEYKVVDTQENVSKLINETKGNNGTNLLKKKLKPSVTNVPYDSDISNSFSKSKGEKYVPVVVSVFILPLIGILFFFIWKKTREVWERRYYRRMDFLIDGMYDG